MRRALGVLVVAVSMVLVFLATPDAALPAQGQGGLQERVASLEALVATLQADLAAETSARVAADAALQAAIDSETSARVAADAALQASIDAVADNTVLGLDNFLSLDTSDPAHPKAVFEAVNVQVIDGTGATISAVPNGLGNLIVGYDESGVTNRVCSVGPSLNEDDCLAAGATWAANQKTGNHNLVVGPGHNYTQSGGVVFGLRNTVNRESATVTGGQNGVAAAERASITGGNENRVSIRWSTISGGFNNEIRFDPQDVNGASVISGGSDNLVIAGEATLGGGNGCVISLDLGWGARPASLTALGNCQ